MESNAGRLLTAEELSNALGLCKSTIYRMSARKLIPSIPVGANLGGRRFDEGQVRSALARLQKQPRPYHLPRDKRAAMVPVGGEGRPALLFRLKSHRERG